MINLNKKISARKTLLPLSILVGLIPAIWGVNYSLQSSEYNCSGVSMIDPSNITAAIIVATGYLPLFFVCLFLYIRAPKGEAAITLSTLLVIVALVISLGASMYVGGLSHFGLGCLPG